MQESFEVCLDKIGWTDRTLLIIDRKLMEKANFELFLTTRFDYLGGIIEREFPQYFEIPKSTYLNNIPISGETKPPLTIKYDSKIDEIYGKKHKVIIFYNPENYEESGTT